jgi:cytidylate kinase
MPLIIAIDGPAAAGKSSVARALSKQLQLIYLDSGSLYRAMSWKVLRKGIDPAHQSEVVSFCQNLDIEIRQGKAAASDGAEVWVNAENVTPFLRRLEVTRIASILSTYPGIREKLLLIQRDIAKQGVVAEGRDVGTVVFPNADFKFYLDANIAVRGKRRFAELSASGIACNAKTVVDEIGERDQRDRERAVAPLRVAPDAMIIDSTALGLKEVIAVIAQTILDKKKR